MKNLLIYAHPDKCFDARNETLAKIQIDNSLELGWKPEDIKLVTNFPFEYRGINSYVLDRGGCDFHPPCIKIIYTACLFDVNFYEDDIYWAHDMDAFQLEPMTNEELGLDGLDGGFNTYCRNSCWQMGSFFFKRSARDIIFALVARIGPGVGKYPKGPVQEEWVMGQLVYENFNRINTRIKIMNNTYDFGMRRVAYCYEKANKPLKVVHFNPWNTHHPALQIAMYGKNELKKPLMNERLIDIFERYGIK